MRFNTLFFLLSLSFLCLALAQVSYDDCCLKYVKKIPHSLQKHIGKYKMQETDGGCNIPAVIFVMKKGRMYCTNPNAEWVVSLMRKIDGRKTKNSQHPKKG